MLIKEAIASSWSRRGTLAFIVLTIALSVALLIGVEKVREEVRASFDRSIAGTDLIVGARGGELQLLLYSVFHIGQATRNISWDSYQKIAANRYVEWAEPISLGDSHRGYRVVGAAPSFFEHIRIGRDTALGFSQGASYKDLYDVVLGAEVAKVLGYQLGEQIVLSHGVGKKSFSDHKDKPFRIVGILAGTGTPVDRSLFVSNEAITAIHVGWEAGVPIAGMQQSAEDVRKLSLTPTDVTAVLIGVKSKLGTFHLQRQINSYRKEPLQAILPGAALQQLWELLRNVESALLIVSACVVVAGLIGMLAVLLTSLSARRRELAIFRAVGARPWHIVFMLVLESALVTLLGALLGLLAAILGLYLLSPVLEDMGLYLESYYPSWEYLTLLLMIVAAGGLTGIWPGLQAYRLSAADGLSSR